MTVAPDSPRPRITYAELEQALRNADPSALLVAQRLIRRVIRHEARKFRLGLELPHRKTYVVDGDRLLGVVDRIELGLMPGWELPRRVILLSSPAPKRLQTRSREEVLTKYSRLLFHARVHVALERRRADGLLTDADLQQRIHALGSVQFAEFRSVLRQENYLIGPDTAFGVYAEFAALYLELRAFDRLALDRTFPGAEMTGEPVVQVLGLDVNAESLLQETRLAGAPEAQGKLGAAARRHSQPSLPDVAPPPAVPTSRPAAPAAAETYRRRAERTAAKGNLVRSALHLLRAGDAAAADARLEALARRLRPCLELDDDRTELLVDVLPAVLARACWTGWSPARRLLHDLQAVCLCQEQATYALQPGRLLFSFGRAPLKRPLPHQGDIRALRHLRLALGRLSACQLEDRDRRHLASLLRDGIETLEHRLRGAFRPRLEAAFDEVGLCPRTFVELLARDQLIAELLDRVVERGFFTIGDLRDALSRNQLKLPDLSGPVELLTGDQLLVLDRKLAVSLDGTYRPGEIYLRWLQRFSSVAFGTIPGRLVTLYVALPFLGSFLILGGLQHLLEKVAWLFGVPAAEPGVPDDGPGHLRHEDHPPFELATSVTVPLFALFLLALIHSPLFRRAVFAGARVAGRGVWRVAVEWPTWVLSWPLLYRLFESELWRRLVASVLKPLAVAGAVGLGLSATGVGPAVSTAAGVLLFGGLCLLFPTRIWRQVEEAALEWSARTWRQISSDIIIGAIKLLLDLFRWLIDLIERCLYAVTEWLRFQGGEGRVSLLVKSVLLPPWNLVQFAAQFLIVVLIEPQVNPIKHFPVVTVSHKLMFPLLWVPLANFLQDAYHVREKRALFLSGTFISLIPGLFGFLVWELKENWRLFRSNRSPTLRPVSIGHHGETMVGLLRPGFHSGTIPKLYARLRRDGRKAQRTGDWRAFRKQRDLLAEAEAAIRHTAERGLAAALTRVTAWGGAAVRVGPIRLTTNQVRVAIECPALGEHPLVLGFAEQGHYLVAGVVEPGWSVDIAGARRGVLALALAGFYKECGVELIREQIRARLGPAVRSFDVNERGLIVWVGPENDPAVYEFSDDAVVTPLPARSGLAAIPKRDLLFTAHDLGWQPWVEAWERFQAGKDDGPVLLPADQVLWPEKTPTPLPVG